MNKLGKIYLISNDINSKLYVGQTIQTLSKRFNGHCCYSKTDRSNNMYIKRAIHKYGRDKFHIKLLEECPIEKFKQYIIEFRPLATEVASHFGISKCSVYNLINRLNDPKLILNSYNPRKGKTIEDINKDELLALYNDGWSIRDLVKKFHIVKPKISKFLKENGIKIRRGIKGYIRRI